MKSITLQLALCLHLVSHGTSNFALAAIRPVPRGRPDVYLAVNSSAAPYLWAIEEHWVAPSMVDLYNANPLSSFGGAPQYSVIGDVGPKRIANMDNTSIAVQVISHTPTASNAMMMPGRIRQANDDLFNATKMYPARYRGFCTLPMAIPVEAAAELRRCVTKLGFVGALVDAHLVVPNRTSGRLAFYDGKEYDVLWKTAVDLDVPIYLHPTYPAIDDILVAGWGQYAPSHPGEFIAAQLGMSGWGWHVNCGLSFLKLYMGGTFERFPKVKIVLGHMGEMVPYWLSRADKLLSGNRTLTLKAAYKNNVWITTSGFFTLENMHTLLNMTDPARVMYSVDYPFGTNEAGLSFMNALKQSGLVTAQQFVGIAYGNAKKLLKVA